jgi:acyl-CoA carboxylase subunit beta
MNAPDLLALLLAPGTFRSWDSDPVDVRPDPSYAADLAEARRKTGLDESVITGEGLLAGRRVAVAASEFGFLGGSIGIAAGERLTRALERATAERLPLICLPASGGTRMQEGTIAFLQMVKITAAVAAHKSAHLSYLVYLRHPTTGGVFASWGSLGHLTLAEPGALIGFLGPRVYQALYGSRFPDGIQTAENLHAHGLIDALVAPADLAAVLYRVLTALTPEPRSAARPGPATIPADPQTTVQPGLTTITTEPRSAVRPGPATIATEPHSAVRPGPATIATEPRSAVRPGPATIATEPRSAVRAGPATIPVLGSEAAWEAVLRTRRADRPGAADLIRLAATDVTRLGQEGLILALARVGGYPCVLIAHDRHGPPPGPAALRLARRGVRLAAGLRLPLVSVIDTAGAGYSPAAEQDGLASQIAHCLAEVTTVPMPTVSLLLGQGAGGAALALLPADRVLAAQHAWLAPLPPEGASALVYRDTSHAAELAARQGIRADDLAAVGLVDHVIPETSEDPDEFCRHLGHALHQALEDLASQDEGARLTDRLRRYRHLGLPAGDQPLPELAPARQPGVPDGQPTWCRRGSPASPAVSRPGVGAAARRPRRSADLVEARWVAVQALGPVLGDQEQLPGLHAGGAVAGHHVGLHDHGHPGGQREVGRR